MKKYLQDKEYLTIVDDILNHPDYQRLKKYKHHGDNRLDHCIRVSYTAYKKAKKKNLKYQEVARAGLLHDCFFVNNQKLNLKTRLYVLKHHPEYALDFAKFYFNPSALEQDIIISHMYPIGHNKPKYKESKLVNRTDKIVSVYDKIYSITNLFK